MKERLEKALEAMVTRRETLLDQYLLSLEKPQWTIQDSMTAVEMAGRLHDGDRHITHLELELKRLEVTRAS